MKTKMAILKENLKDIHFIGPDDTFHKVLKSMQEYADQFKPSTLGEKPDYLKEREEAMEYAHAIYPMANEDDFPDFPNVNRINKACLGAFGNGYEYAMKFLSTENSEKDKQIEELKYRAEKFEAASEQYKENWTAAVARAFQLTQDKQELLEALNEMMEFVAITDQNERDKYLKAKSILLKHQ